MWFETIRRLSVSKYVNQRLNLSVTSKFKLIMNNQNNKKKKKKKDKYENWVHYVVSMGE